MGMYNEVFKRCPYCGYRGYLQIHQIVSGFGEFDLDQPEELARVLDNDQLKELYDAVQGEIFHCLNDIDCDSVFEPFDNSKQERLELARKLFGQE